MHAGYEPLPSSLSQIGFRYAGSSLYSFTFTFTFTIFSSTAGPYLCKNKMPIIKSVIGVP